MDMISAALGLEYGSDEEMRALAERLRKEKRAADVFALSPTFEKQAAAQQQNILSTAETAGLARAKELERQNQKRMSDERNAATVAAAFAAAGNAGDKAYSEARGKADSDSLENLFEKAGVAEGLISQFDAFQEMMSGVSDSGALAGIQADIGRLGASLGLEIDPKADRLQAAQAISNQIALRLRNPESGMGLTGNTSDRDVRFLKESVPRIQNSEGGNALLLEMWRRVQRRVIEKAQAAAQYEQEHGRFSKPRFEAEWKKYIDANPLFTDIEEQFTNTPPPEGFVED